MPLGVTFRDKTGSPTMSAMPPAISVAEFARLISVERFATYRLVTASAEDAMRLYEWNAHISGAFAELLHHVEILVRNTMHDALTAHHAMIPGRPPGAAWFDAPPWVRHHWFNFPAQQSVDKAIARAAHRPAQPVPARWWPKTELRFLALSDERTLRTKLLGSRAGRSRTIWCFSICCATGSHTVSRSSGSSPTGADPVPYPGISRVCVTMQSSSSGGYLRRRRPGSRRRSPI